MASEPMHFNHLPLDIKKNIILGYMTRPEDLKSLCLSSKELRDIATPPLYRKVLLFIGGHKDVRVSGLLSRTNPGIQHIRKIYLQLEKTPLLTQEFQVNSDDSSEDEGDVQIDITGAARQAQFTVRLLLDFLPNDILENFSWQNWEPFSMDNWVLLMKKQRRLKAVEIESVDRNFMPELEKNPRLLTDLEGATSLHFYPDTLDRLKACQKVVETQPKFTELQLSSGFAYAGGGQVPDDLEDSSTRPGLLTRTIFGHMMPFETCTPVVLKKLSIDNIDLCYAADTYMKFIKFSALESLVIGGCQGVDAVFAQMSKPHLRPTKLKKIRWFHGEETTDSHALEAFDGLLEAIIGLEIVHVDIKHFNALPNPTAIAHHGKTLQVLGIRSRDATSNPLKYESEQLDEICTACTELRQLSITLPSTCVSDAHPSSDFKQHLRCLKKLRYLITLNLHSWPMTRSSFVSRNYKLKHEWYDLYEHALQRLAQQIFEASDAHSKEQGWGLGHRSLLAVVAFGANGKSPPDVESNFQLKQLPFVRGLKVDPFGKTEMLAVKTLWKMVQFIEPESDILNHSIYDLHDAHNTP